MSFLLVVWLGLAHASNPATGWLDLTPEELHAHEVTWRRDPSTACRRPAAYEYLRLSGRLFGPPVDQLCPDFALVSERGERIDFNYRRLLEIQYLVAGRGGGFASRFGHAMLRFVFCAPHRARVDASCREDEFEAVDVGFAAHTETQTFSILGGVTGKYPSWLIAQFDSDLRHRYLDEELRELVAAPLVLDDDARRLLFHYVVERHWSYDGRYKFLSDNCAVELLKLIQASVPSSHHLVTGEPDVLRPMGLFRALRRDGLIGDEIFAWPSRRPVFESRLRALPLDPAIKTVKEYVSGPAAMRAAWVKQATGQAALFAALEAVPRKDAQAALVRAAMNALFHSKDMPDCGRSKTELAAALEVASFETSPRQLKSVPAKDIPRPAEVVDETELGRRRAALDHAVADVIDCFKDAPAVARARAEVEGSAALARGL